MSKQPPRWQRIVLIIVTLVTLLGMVGISFLR